MASQRRQGGSALIVVVFVLTIVSFLSISAMRNSERESTVGGRSRSTSRTLAAADAGLQLALSRLAQNPPNLNSFDVDLADGANVQSRARGDAGPQILNQLRLGTRKEGYGVGVGSGVGFVTRVFLVNATATAGGSTVELQAKLGRSAVEAVGY
jgi:Tfp pilus assembly protein PilX